ncbi:SusC/RagA family TonB-linked outer membrane protein [Gelidibacter salicanalis]|nr:TonB-dependent receptor [Gelidibacter salicanalis]
MKTFIFLLCTTAFSFNTENSFAQHTITISQDQLVTVDDVFKIIKKQTNYLFIYPKNLFKNTPKIELKKGEIKIEKILQQSLEINNLSFELTDEKTILISEKSTASSISKLKIEIQQEIKGTVTDAQGLVLPGVSVMIKGTNKGTVTNFDGEYFINASTGQELLFSYVGMTSVSIAIVEGKTTVNVTLQEEALGLNEVVVIGYGNTRKKDLSTAVGTVNFTKEMKSRALGFEGMLQGQIAGVTVANTGGDPLSKPSITIRGQGSRMGDQVLYIVDGVPGAPFNTEDIESISVLKDAASAAIYGAHVGSGGVIVVTTKKAKAGDTKITANISSGFAQAVNLPKMTNAAEYADIMQAANLAAGNSLPGYIDPSKYVYARTTRTDWMDEIFRTGTYKHTALSISGGSEKMRSLASVSYDKREGVLLNTFNKNIGGKINLDYDINKYITFSERVGYNYSNGQGGLNTQSHTGVIAQAMQMPASASIYEYTEDGMPVYGMNGQQAYGGTTPQWASQYAGSFGEVQNPVATLQRLTQNRPSHQLMSTSTITIKPISSLTFTSNFTVGYNSDRYEDFSKRVTEIGNPKDENSRNIFNSLSNNWLWESVATYSAQLNNEHRFNLMAGYTMGYDNHRANSTTVYDFSREDSWAQIFVNGNNWSKDKPTEVFWEQSKVSSFGRASYSYDDRYFFTGSLRYDATSRLSKDNRSQVFPAVSAGWKLSSEPFFEKLGESINLLKFRGSWGRIGNISSVGYYANNIKFSESPWFTYFGDQAQTPVKGISLDTFLNPNLRWETTEQIDLGFDLNLFDDRFTFVMDWFRKDTKDLIEDLVVSPTAGIEVAPKGNVGKVRNSGFEFAATYSDKIGNVRFNVGANFATLKNQLLDLGDIEYLAHRDDIRGFRPLRSAVKESWYSYFLIPTDGIFRSQAEVDTHNAENGREVSGTWTGAQMNAKPGDIRFRDVDGNGIINEDDRVYMDSYAPKLTYALNLGAEWEGFDFSMQWQGVGGNKIFNGAKVMSYATETGWNLSKELLNSYTFNENSNTPRVIVNDPNGNYTTLSDYFLENGSYLRLKNLTIGYTVPPSVLSKWSKNTSIRIYTSGENLFTYTKYSGMDPEVGRLGLDGGRYPISRIINFGLNLNF